MEKEDVAVSEEDILKLKKEIEQLRNNRESPAALKHSVDHLIAIFEQGIKYVEEDKGHSTINAVNEIKESIQGLLDENVVIAKGLVELTKAVEGMSERVEGIMLSFQQSLVKLGPGEDTSNKRISKHPHRRKEDLEKLRREFQK